MRSDRTIDLVEERRSLEETEPALVDSYRDFVSSYSQYRRLEKGLAAAKKDKAFDGTHLARPAALSGITDD